MRKVEIQCDHCGKSINPMIDFEDLTIDVEFTRIRNVDLCVDCLGELCKLVSDFIKR